ncbi:MAG TPA: hypothetical protein VMQ73_18830 [Methylomirabilota bacterium]|nr:hypothetical protein [Methylomirabilota bacterium]
MQQPAALASCTAEAVPPSNVEAACAPAAAAPAGKVQKPTQLAYANPTERIDSEPTPADIHRDNIYDEIYGLQQVQSLRLSSGGMPVLVVQGVVVNMSRQQRAVPPLVAIVSDDQGNELQRWSFNAEVATLAPGASSGFRSEYFDSGAGGTKVTITFAPEQRAAQ